MLKKIPVDDLRLGMHLHAMCGAWLDHPFWRTKFILNDPADLERVVRETVGNWLTGLGAPAPTAKPARPTVRRAARKRTRR